VTYEKAVAACRAGVSIRHPGMSKGWKIESAPGTDVLFCINPHTGSDYQFVATPDDLARADWQVARARETLK
jgi:hypothetical protein